MNFENFGNQPMDSRSGSGQPAGNFPLVRQGLLRSLTFDELRNTTGATGKDFGSMNMEELLKHILNTLGYNSSTMEGLVKHLLNTLGYNCVGDGGANLQREGSLTPPRTLSQKTVDEVWSDISKEYSNGFGQPNLPQRQKSLGEMTLEEFLVKAGVVREETQLDGKQHNTGLFPNLTNSPNNPGFGPIGLQQAVGQNAALEDGGSNPISFQFANLLRSGNVVPSTPQTQQPQKLSQKTGIEAWNGFGKPNLPKRQQSLGEMTLEEFLVKAGVVSEETRFGGKPNDNGVSSTSTNQQPQLFRTKNNLPHVAPMA